MPIWLLYVRQSPAVLFAGREVIPVLFYLSCSCGFTKSIKEEQVLDIPVLTRAFEKAVETGYKAAPRSQKEGTILTVAKGASDKAKELCEDGADDLEQFLGTVIEHARYVLSQTPEMLPVLKQAGVVGFRWTGSGRSIKRCL